MKALIVIPARMGSMRLPGKPLADIAGRAMIVRVCDVAAAADCGPVVVAAAEPEIAAAVQAAGYHAELTDPDLPSGSDRVWAASQAFDPQGEYDIIVNLQGDMPTLAPQALEQVINALKSLDADIATLASEITDAAERADPNVVKAILSLSANAMQGRALYFTRATAPTGPGPLWHHVGVYAYRRAALRSFVEASPSPLELRERLEQLRALELGLEIGCAILSGPPPNGVDTPGDLAAARAHFIAQGEGQS